MPFTHHALFPRALRAGLLLALVGAAAAAPAMAAPIQQGRYRLGNHPDGNARPPLYGLRLDELFNVTGGHDIFTFDFGHTQSAVFMDIFGSTIHIHGQAFGGRDVGSAYADDVYRGVYAFDFTYDTGVMPAPGDDDLWVNTTNHINRGSITAPGMLGEINLVDERGSFAYSFRLGDENNDAGHRGFSGISGWGWLSVESDSGIRHSDSMDWLFTARFEGIIPAPSAAALLGLGGLVAARRRR